MNTYSSYQWVELGCFTHKFKISFSGGHSAIGSLKPLTGSLMLLEDVGLHKVVKEEHRKLQHQ